MLFMNTEWAKCTKHSWRFSFLLGHLFNFVTWHIGGIMSTMTPTRDEKLKFYTRAAMLILFAIRRISNFLLPHQAEMLPLRKSFSRNCSTMDPSPSLSSWKLFLKKKKLCQLGSLPPVLIYLPQEGWLSFQNLKNTYILSLDRFSSVLIILKVESLSTVIK